MYRLFCKDPLRQVWAAPRVPTGTAGRATTNLCFLLHRCLTSISHASSDSESQSSAALTVSYLVDSCGLSPTAAASVAKQIRIRNTGNPDSVLNCLKDYGFTENHIKKLVTKRPALLLARAEDTLKPKLEFFRGVGYSVSGMANFLCSNPQLFHRGLENQLIASFDFMRTIVGNNEKVMIALTRSTWVLRSNPRTILLPNITILRECGIPEPRLLKMILLFPMVIARAPSKLASTVALVKSMGFDPSTTQFTLAVHVILARSESNWEKKVGVYRSLGWSQDDIWTMFKLQPWSMSLSEKKIRKLVDFFVNKRGWKRSFIIKYSNVLLLSLEKRIIPRCSVIDVLISNGLIAEEELNYHTALKISEKDFLKKFMIPYQEKVPDILNLYQQQMVHEVST